MNNLNTILVVGGSRGIGKSTVLKLQNTYKILYTYKNNPIPSDLINRDNVIGYRCDNESKDDINKTLEKINKDSKNQLFGLVLNAGVVDNKLLLRITDEDIEKIYNVNLFSYYKFIRGLIISIGKSKGRVIFISSVVGFTGSAGQTIYAATKSAQLGLMRSLVREYSKRNITFNMISPGYIETDMTSSLSELQKDAILKSIPLSRFGSPDDVSNIIEFLLSNNSSYINGTIITCDGGLSMGH